MELTDINNEEMILSILLGGNNDERLTIFEQVTHDDFYFPPNQQLFDLLKVMYESEEPLNVASLYKLHPEVQKINTRSNAITINTLYTNVKNSGGLLDNSDKDYATVSVMALKKNRQRRELDKLANDISKAVHDGKSPAAIYDAIEKTLLARTETGFKRSYMTPEDMAKLMIEAVSERMDDERKHTEVIFTSYASLNKMTGGFERGDLVILSAGSGVGKSAFSMNIVRDVAYVDKKAVLYLNSEMSDRQQARRYASMLAKVSHQGIREGLKVDSATDDFGRVCVAAENFKNKKIYTVTIPDLQLNNVVTEVKRMKARFGIELVVVDYIGRMDTISNHDAAEWQLMEQAARTLKTLAQELQIVVIMVAQLSSNGTTLAKGASMKNECDLWLNLKRITPEDRANYQQFLHKPLEDYWNTLIEFRKARNVETGARLKMHFHGDTLTFTDNADEAQKYQSLEELNEREKTQ